MPAGLSYTLGRTLYLALTNRCNAATLPSTRGPGFAMPAASGFAPLPPGFEPEAADAIEAVADAFRDGEPEGVVFAGLGEPLLRLPVLLESAHAIGARWPTLPLRLSTNGLVDEAAAADVASQLRGAGISRATVALASADPLQHAQLLAPADAAAHADVCAFVRRLVASGVAVECTAVECPGVDLAAAERLAAALGASFRPRSWHP